MSAPTRTLTNVSPGGPDQPASPNDSPASRLKKALTVS